MQNLSYKCSCSLCYQDCWCCLVANLVLWKWLCKYGRFFKVFFTAPSRRRLIFAHIFSEKCFHLCTPPTTKSRFCIWYIYIHRIIICPLSLCILILLSFLLLQELGSIVGPILFCVPWYTVTHPSPTSLEGTLDPFLRDHQLSTIAMRQDRTTPAAKTQKTPAKLWMSRALPRCRVWTEL